MLKSYRKYSTLALVGGALAVFAFLPGCGGGDNGGNGATDGNGGTTTETAGAGKQLFIEKCGSCHVLAAAGTSGAVGPDLDKKKYTAATVAKQITNPKKTMPANLVTGDEVDEVADYVAEVSGK